MRRRRAPDGGGPRAGELALLRVDRALELGLAHLRATLHPETARLLVELLAGTPSRTRTAGAQSARRPEERSEVEVRERVLDSPLRSYWRARLLPFFTPLGGMSGPPGRLP